MGGPGPGADLTPLALAQIQAFVRAGGTLVGYRRAGLTVAEAAGLTAASEATPPSGFQIPGASLRIELDAGDPLAWGFDGETFVFDNADPILQPGGARVVGSYPTGERFFASGYTEGAGALRGTAAVLDQPAGAGRALLMSFDPNFRAYTEAGERLFANAVLYPAPPAAAARVARARRDPSGRARSRATRDRAGRRSCESGPGTPPPSRPRCARAARRATRASPARPCARRTRSGSTPMSARGSEGFWRGCARRACGPGSSCSETGAQRLRLPPRPERAASRTRSAAFMTRSRWRAFSSGVRRSQRR